MTFLCKQNEATAERRRIPIYLVDATDRFTPETGIVAPTIEWSKNGGGQSAGAGNWGEVGDGIYYYEATQGEMDTLGGGHTVRIVKAGVTAEFVETIFITAYDPYAVAGLGLTNLDATVASRATQSSVDTIDGLVDTLITRLTEARAGYLDNLSVGPVAQAAALATVDTVADDILALVTFLKRIRANKRVWDDVLKQWDIYNDAGAAVIYNEKPKTKTAGDVTMSATAPSNSDGVAP